MRTLDERRFHLSELNPAPWNYKSSSEEKINKFKKSVEKNGFIYRLVVAHREEDPEVLEVCDGNHRLRVLQEMPYVETIPCYYLGVLPKQERMRIGIELNEWAFDTDPLSLAQCLKDISDTTEDLETLPYNRQELDQLISLVAADFDEVEDTLPEEPEEELVDLPTKSNDSVPEVTMVFATHTEYTEFVQTLGFESGQRVNYGAFKEAILREHG